MSICHESFKLGPLPRTECGGQQTGHGLQKWLLQQLYPPGPCSPLALLFSPCWPAAQRFPEILWHPLTVHWCGKPQVCICPIIAYQLLHMAMTLPFVSYDGRPRGLRSGQRCLMLCPTGQDSSTAGLEWLAAANTCPSFYQPSSYLVVLG